MPGADLGEGEWRLEICSKKPFIYEFMLFGIVLWSIIYTKKSLLFLRANWKLNKHSACLHIHIEKL